MFTLTIERQQLFDAANIYPFGEKIDKDSELSYYVHLNEYMHVLHEKFQQAVLTHTLFQEKKLMIDFEKWCTETIDAISTLDNAVYDKREAITARFSDSGRAILSQSLHDGKIIFAAQHGTDYVLLLDMSGGFTVQSIIRLTFENAVVSGELEGYYVYDELIEADGRFGLRVLSSFGSPYVQWTIWFDDVKAQYVYRPAVYVEPGDVDTWEDFVEALNKDDCYYVVLKDALIEVTLSSFRHTEEGIFAGDLFLGKNFDAARERIYCGTHEDPYAHFSEPLAVESLFEAAFGDNQTLKVRAFNTIFALGEEVAHIVNNILRKAEFNEEEMYFNILASHFEQLHCLTEDNRVKWLNH